MDATSVASTTSVTPGLIVFGVIALLAIIGALKGFSRGISRQILRTITIIASVIISVLVASGVFTSLVSSLQGSSMEEIEVMIRDSGIFEPGADLTWLQNLDIETIILILTIPMALIVMPLVFVISFIIISAILLIVHGILAMLFGLRKKRNNIITRLLGMALGFIQGVAVAGFILMPLIGITTSVRESVDVLREKAPEEEATIQLAETYDTYLKDICEHPAVAFLGNVGINGLYKNIATVEIDKTETDMTKLLPDLAIIVCNAGELEGADMKKLTPENEATITDILNTVESNPYLTKVLAGTMKMVSYAYTNGAMNIELEEPLKSVLDSAISIFHTSDATNIHGDIDTIINVYFTLSRDEILSSFDQGSEVMLEKLTKQDDEGNTTVKKVINIINSNERTKPLVTLLTKLSITVMSQQTGIDGVSDEVYDNVKTGINETLQIKQENYETKEEYISAVSDSLDNTLQQNNINLDKEIVDTMAEFITDNFADKEEVTDDDINEVIISYYDAYLEYQQSGELPEDLPEGFPEDLPENLPEDLPEGFPF